MRMVTLIMDKNSRLMKREGGYSNYISFLFILPILLALFVGGSYVAKSLQMMSTLNHGLTIVSDNMTQDGSLTTKGQNQLISYLQNNRLDLSKVYLNATTTTQSFGSRGLEATLGYDLDLYAPGTSHVIWHKYYEVSSPMVQSQLIPGSGADSGSVALSSVFAGNEGGTDSGGSSSGSTPVNNAVSITLQANNNSPIVNAPVIVSGKVYFNSGPAPAGTLVSLHGGGISQNVSTDSNGNFSASVSFSQPGTVVLQGSSGAATASVSLTVQVNSPKTILLQIPTTVRVGDPLTVTGSVLDSSGNSVMDGTVVTISSSDTTDIPATQVTTQAWSFTLSVNKITTVNQISITASAGSASATLNVTVIPGDPKTISLNVSSSGVVAGSTVTFSGQVLGPYGTPPATGTPVTILSGTDVTDTLPSLTTDSSGNFTGTATLTKAGSQAFYAQTTGSVLSPTVAVTVTAASPYKVQGITGTPNPVNTGSSVSISGYVCDQYNNPVASGTSLKIASSALSSPVSTSVLSGTFNGRVTLQTPGVQTLNVEDGSGNSLSGGSFSVNVLPTAAYSLTPSQGLYTITAGQSIGSVVFTLEDSNGQPVAGKTVQFSETPQGNTMISPISAITDSLGHVQTTVGALTTAGSQSLIATLAGDSSVVGTVGITVSPGSPRQVIANVSPSTTQVNKTPYPIVSGIISDTYGNPIVGATVGISGGYGLNASGSTGSNGYYTISIDPTNVGGPFTLTFSISSAYGNYSTSQGTITVTAVPVVPVQDVLQGVVIDGQTGTMTNRSGSFNYTTWANGNADTGVDYLVPQGYYDGNTQIWSSDGNLVPGNIKSGVSVFGVTGTYSGQVPVHGSQTWTTPGTYYWTVPNGVSGVMAMVTAGGGGGGEGAFGWDTYYTLACGGGGGGTNINFVTITPGQVVTIVVGAGGYAGNTGPSFSLGTGGQGQSSSFGSLTATGGQGAPQYASFNGQANARGGAGGGYGQNGQDGSVPTGGLGMGGYGNGGTGNGYGSYPGGSGRVVIQW